MAGAAMVAADVDCEAGSAVVVVVGKPAGPVFGVPVEVGGMIERDERSVQGPRETVLGGPCQISVPAASLRPRVLAQWAGEGTSRSAWELLRYNAAGSTAERLVAAALHARRKTRILV